jgi:hypothetical protein
MAHAVSVLHKELTTVIASVSEAIQNARDF